MLLKHYSKYTFLRISVNACHYFSEKNVFMLSTDVVWPEALVFVCLGVLRYCYTQ